MNEVERIKDARIESSKVYIKQFKVPRNNGYTYWCVVTAGILADQLLDYLYSLDNSLDGISSFNRDASDKQYKNR